MLRTDRKFQFTPYDTTLEKEYLVRPGDIIDLKVFSNNGYELVDVLNTAVQRLNQFGYVVNPRGYAVFPLLDSVSVAGKTLPEVNKLLQIGYGYYFVNPFIKTSVLNRRAILFMGSNKANVVQLESENTGIMEVLASANGFNDNLRADRIKIIRGDLKNPSVFLIDLSTIEGLKKASTMNVEPNDIIYVEPSENAIAYISKVTPVLGFFSSIFGFYLIYLSIKKP